MSTLNMKNEHTSTANQLIGDQLTVLAVDDQPICRAILEKLLEAQGVTVETAQDGEEALLMWAAKQHPLIITDCHMPKMDGYSLAKAIRRLEQAEHINNSTIIALTSNAFEEEEHRYVQAGMNGFLSKPINHAQIETLFASWRSASSANQNTKKSIDNDQSNLPLVDYAILAQIFPDTAKQTKILKDLHNHIQNDCRELQQHAQQENWLEIESTAHRIKGSCKMVGVNGIANICEGIEKEAKNGTAANDISLAALDESIRAFSAYLNQPSRPQHSTANTDLRGHS